MQEHSKQLEDTAVWKTYVAKLPKDSSRHDWVYQVYKTSCQYLKEVLLKFPNYTLHDETHVQNVLDAMGGILGDKISDLSKGEAELLILTACLHDVGMVYMGREAEQCFNNTRLTREFLRANKPELMGRPADEWPEDLQQWYLRWLHPRRLPQVLENKSWKSLLSAWPQDAVQKTPVIAVCQAHGKAPEKFLSAPALRYLPASDVDPLFCALLLRLADLLDFDDTRAPKVLYSYVACNEESRKEWDKHQASAGFNYPDLPSTAKLPCKASCTDPGIEHAVRNFLDWIDDELDTCARLQQHCHKDWQRSFPFPQSIDRKEIESKGYLSDNFRMTMDQTQIMNLLTGEQLYDRNDVFVRELLQNSIDATLLRLEMDQTFTQEDARIDLWEWSDRDGNIWFRIDDQGTGMTLGTFQRYFLKIGNSYYTSRELTRDLRDHGQREDYTSISRFGIGFLSCFLCGTYAEVSTLYFDPKKNQEESGSDSEDWIPGYGLRLQVTGLQGYYILKSQADQHAADVPMPAPEDYASKAVSDLEWDGYRAKPGTSISVKLDPGRLGAVDLRESVMEYLCCAKVPVYYNGERIGQTYKESMDKIHELEGEHVYNLTPELQKKFEECFPDYARQHPKQYPKVCVTVVPLDTEKNRILDSMSGVFLKYDVKFDGSPQWQVKGREYRISVYISADGVYPSLRLTSQAEHTRNPFYDWNDFIRDCSPQEVNPLIEALEALPAPPASADELGEAWRPFEREGRSFDDALELWLDYSQIKGLDISFQELGIPTIKKLTRCGKSSDLVCSYRGVIAGDIYSLYNQCQILLLLDHELRPTVKASRSVISDMPLELTVAICGMVHAWADGSRTNIILSDWSIPSLPAWQKLHNTRLESWLRDNLGDDCKNLKEKLEMPVFAGGLRIRSDMSETGNVLQAFLMSSLQDFYQMKVNFEEGQVITFTKKSPEEDGGPYDLFPPMMFCTSATQASRQFLCSRDVSLRRCINVDHPYAAWLLKSAHALNKYYNRQFKQIIEALCNVKSEDIIKVCNKIREQLLPFTGLHGIDVRACPQLNEADFWSPSEKPEDI